VEVAVHQVVVEQVVHPEHRVLQEQVELAALQGQVGHQELAEVVEQVVLQALQVVQVHPVLRVQVE
jgi:hypothetical protein